MKNQVIGAVAILVAVLTLSSCCTCKSQLEEIAGKLEQVRQEVAGLPSKQAWGKARRVFPARPDPVPTTWDLEVNQGTKSESKSELTWSIVTGAVVRGAPTETALLYVDAINCDAVLEAGPGVSFPIDADGNTLRNGQPVLHDEGGVFLAVNGSIRVRVTNTPHPKWSVRVQFLGWL